MMLRVLGGMYSYLGWVKEGGVMEEGTVKPGEREVIAPELF